MNDITACTPSSAEDLLVQQEVKKQLETLLSPDMLSSILRSSYDQATANQNMPIGEIIQRGLDFLNKYEMGEEISRVSIRRRLQSNIKGLGSVADVFNSVGVFTGKDINKDTVFAMYKTYQRHVDNLNYRTAIMSSVRKMLWWGMQEGLIARDENLLPLCRQKQPLNNNIKAPSREDLDKLARMTLGKSKLVAVQMYFIISVLMIRLGLRSAEEIVNIDIDDVDIKNRTLWVHRKGGTYQPVTFAKDLVPIFRYMRLVRYLHLKKYNDTDALPFIVKMDKRIRGRGTSIDWRLRGPGLLRRWRDARRKIALPEDRKLYDFRKLSVSVQARVGRVMGIAVADIAFRNNHSRDVFNNHYNVLIHDHAELLSRDLPENVQFVKERLIDCEKVLDKDPEDISARASYWSWFFKLGKLQNELDVDTYRGKQTNASTFGLGKSLDQFRALSAPSNLIPFDSYNSDISSDYQVA